VTLYLLCGKIAAGKSTLARRLADRPNTVLIAEDHWNSNLFKDELRTIDDYINYSRRLRNAMGPHVVALLKAGTSVVLDFQANTRAVRGWMRGIIEESAAAHELHVLDIPDEICRQRMHQRNASGEHPFQLTDADFETFGKYFASPAPDEGFNVVVHTA
jgi:predicted kinase